MWNLKFSWHADTQKEEIKVLFILFFIQKRCLEYSSHARHYGWGRSWDKSKNDMIFALKSVVFDVGSEGEGGDGA